MRTAKYIDPATRINHVSVAMTDVEILLERDIGSLVDKVRYEIVSALTVQIMEKLGPLVDEVLHEAITRLHKGE